MAKVTTSELDKLIRRTIREKGLSADIGEDKITEIKNKIKELAGVGKPTSISNEVEKVLDVSPEVPKEEPGTVPPTITQSSETNTDAIEVAKKEGEVQEKENEISEKEAQLANKEAEIQRKQDELSYKPIIPAVLNNVGPEKLFVFNTNEISLGTGALTNNQFRLISNPDNKKSMQELWSENGIKSAEIFIVKFEKIGNIEFNPFAGTSHFEEKRFEEDQTPSNVPLDGLTPEQAINSQKPVENMVDAIEPVSDVVLPPSKDMGLTTKVDLEKSIKDAVDSILRKHYSGNNISNLKI